MPRLIWNESGTRFYESGVDRGVLYLPNGSGVPWNGLTSVDESGTDATEPVHFDGVKTVDIPLIGEYEGTLQAYTYPDEFLEFEGIASQGNGLYVDNQASMRFGLSYRTQVGNDIDGADHGYKIHIVYNLMAVPASPSYQTLSEQQSATDFSWSIAAVPEWVSGYRPTAHVVLDSRDLNPFLLRDLERILYGDANVNASLPPLSELVDFVSNWSLIEITDNGDGTWTAEGPDELVTMTDATTFEIDQVVATYLNNDTYEVSTTKF